MTTYGSYLGILSDELLIEKYGLSNEFLQKDLDAYRGFDYYKLVGASDTCIKKTGILSDVDIKLKYDFLSECTDGEIINKFRNYEYMIDNDIAGITVDKMSKTNIYLNNDAKIVLMSDVAITEYTNESVYKVTMNEAKNFLLDEIMESKYLNYEDLSPLEKIKAKQYDYEKGLVSDMIDRGVTSRNGVNLLSADELKCKYSFIDDATDASIIKELQLSEYRAGKYGADAVDKVTLYFDEAGKVAAVSNQRYDVNIEGKVNYTTKIDDYLNYSKNFLLDETMESIYKGYKDMTPLEKIYAKKLDYDCRMVNLHLDKVTISDTTMNKYLTASKKTAGQLNSTDMALMKLADCLTGGKDDVAKSITNLANSCKTIGKGIKILLPAVDILGTLAIAAISINQAIDLYEAGYQNEASAVMTSCAISMVGGIAGGTALTGAISPYLVGFGTAVGGSVGATVGDVVSGIIGYGVAGLASTQVG